jgi:ribosomal protein S18 acetylase RimI-like enzyme
MIRYDTSLKTLPFEQLHRLFVQAGWSDGTESVEIYRNFSIPFTNSTFVVSAWDNEKLVGAVRALSDRLIRSVIYDLVVDTEYRKRGIGRELVNRCIEQCPTSEWLIQTEEEIAGYYERLGFSRHSGVFIYIPSRWDD